jgi:hypothetical protein
MRRHGLNVPDYCYMKGDVMYCTFIPISEPDERGWRTWKCSREACGRATAPTPHEANRIFATCRVWGWGDRLAWLLWMVGITKERVEWVTGKPCNCDENQHAMNTWGERLRAWWFRE